MLDADKFYKFQSAPAIAGGRCIRPPCGPRACSCFNPRPPLLAGDALQVHLHGAHLVVSIRARHCWRAMPRPGKQPIHRRAFQSAPAIAGGRCTATAWALVRLRRFNPRPPLLAGDAGAPRQRGQPEHVSIRARHCWRAMRQRPAPLTSPCPRFNPRPPLLAGDAMDALDRPHEITVSIRARHCWRAMPARGLVAQLRQLKVSIRARHCWRAMPSTYQPRVMLASFQSAPAIAGGRCSAWP